MWIHSFKRKLFALSNAVSGKVVRRSSCKLFGLKSRGDIFFESPCILIPPGLTQEMKLMGPGGEGPSRYPPAPPGFSSHGTRAAEGAVPLRII